MRIIAYTRVSTAEQAASGYGLEAQAAAIRESCERRGWEIAELVRDEGASGSSIDRPGLERALRRVAAGDVDGLVVAKLDRLSRSVIDFGLLLEWFTAAEATFVALDLSIDTSTASGRLVANVMAAVAEWERGTIAERTRDGLAALRATGRPTGRPAVADRPELAERIRRMHEQDGKTLSAIAAQLNAEGVPTLRGGTTWRHSSVQSAAGYRRPARRRKDASLPAVSRRPPGRNRPPRAA